MFKIILSGTEPRMVQPEQEQVYEIQYFKTAIDADGKEVEVVDEFRRERKTVAQLEADKTALQAQIKEVDAKLADIAKL